MIDSLDEAKERSAERGTRTTTPERSQPLAAKRSFLASKDKTGPIDSITHRVHVARQSEAAEIIAATQVVSGCRQGNPSFFDGGE